MILFCVLQLYVQGKLPLTGINVTGIEDTDEIRNALEITGMIIVIFCVIILSYNEHNKYAFCNLENNNDDLFIYYMYSYIYFFKLQND